MAVVFVVGFVVFAVDFVVVFVWVGVAGALVVVCSVVVAMAAFASRLVLV